MSQRDAKRSARSLFQARRREKTLHPELLEREHEAIIDQALALIRTYSIKETAAYSAFPSEPGGRLLLPRIAAAVDTLWLPISADNGILYWAKYQGTEHLHSGKLGIAEPDGPSYPTSALTQCPLIFIPALGCTTEGIRLGKGGGYYDRALAELHEYSPRPLSAALLFNEEIDDSLPTDPHDMPVDFIITPSGTTAVSASSKPM